MRMKDSASRYSLGMDAIARQLEKVCNEANYEISTIYDRSLGIPDRSNGDFIQYTTGLHLRGWPELTTRHHKPSIAGEIIITAIVEAWINKKRCIVEPYSYPVNGVNCIRMWMEPYTDADRNLFLGIDPDHPILKICIDYEYKLTYEDGASP